MPELLVDGVKIHFQHHPATSPLGPALMLVHGAGGNLMHWPGELRRLPGYEVYALDLPGHGHSEGRGSSDIGEYAELVARFASALGLSALVFGGHSMGGAIAQEFALRYPARTAGLVLIGTGARLRVTPQLLAGIRNDFDNTVELLASWTYGERPDPVLLRIYLRRLRETPPDILHSDLLACREFDRVADVFRITAPTLVLCGSADRMTPVTYSLHLAEQIPGARLVSVPRAGHMVMLEQPKLVAEAVAHFLAGLGAA